LINEAMAEALGWSGEAVGKTISAGQELRVAGVVKDFHFNIMKHQIEPLMMYYNPGGNRAVTLKVDTRNLSETMQEVESKWAAVNPGVPFEYTFFDEEFAQQFESEQYFSRLVLIFTWLAIFIACLGLLGLSAFAAEQRTKEIGVRKVLGASTRELVQLLSRELSFLVLIAAALAIPVSWYVMSGWLENYYYRIDMPWWVFPSAIVLALMIALLTNAYHAVKTARANPVTALRSE
jgi:putative ABC transport system permease protein